MYPIIDVSADDMHLPYQAINALGGLFRLDPSLGGFQ
jgi:hypothetical protein